MIEVTGSLADVGPFGHFAYRRPIYCGPGGGMSRLNGAIDKSGNDEIDEKLIQQSFCLGFSNAI